MTTKLKACKWCGTGFNAEGDLCGKCKEDKALNDKHNAAREADVRPSAEFCNAHPEDGEHERNKADRDHCVYCGARLTTP